MKEKQEEYKNCGVVCLNKKPKEYNKLFFGDYGNFQRTDIVHHEIFKKLAEASEANTWFMNEIDYSKDKKGHSNLNNAAFRMFHLNILYQSLLDSLVPNIASQLAEIATDSWLSYCYNRVSVEESIHALTYSSGLEKVFGSKATQMIDHIYKDKVVKNRADEEIESAQNFIKIINNDEVHLDDKKKAVLDVLIRTYFLEGVKFPFSFFTTWTINKSFGNAIQGFSQALKLIGWDELTFHAPLGLNVMKILMREEDQEFMHLKEWFNERVKQIAIETQEGELEWNKYLHDHGEEEGVPGFNEEIGEHFIKYMIDYRLKSLDIEPLNNEEKSDIIDWFNEYRNLNKTQVALQEADSTNYQKGKLVNDLDIIDEDEYLQSLFEKIG